MEESTMENELIYNILTLSTKGQISIPIEIRKALGLEEGDKFTVYCDGKTIILKPIPKLTPEEIEEEFRKEQEWAKEVGLTEEDIFKAIKEVRAEARAKRKNNS